MTGLPKYRQTADALSVADFAKVSGCLNPSGSLKTVSHQSTHRTPLPLLKN
jgi:hypothetical protein